jgi:D-alanyl-D-alanine endopeptidase (penicillin-binding protein 7)
LLLGFFIFSNRRGIVEEVWAGQTNNGAAAPTRTVPATRSTPSSQAHSKSSADSHSRLKVRSRIALVVDADTSQELVTKNVDQVVPIASITKLMTAMVVLDTKLPLEEKLKISDEDQDLVMGTFSRLRVGWTLSREDMLHLALMSSENRAAAALSRYYPGGRPAFIDAMNAKAAELEMSRTHFVNPNGLTNENVSTAADLVKLVQAADQYPLIRQFTTDPSYDVRIGRYVISYINSNRLVGRPDWDIELQKTGFTNEAGRCLVMLIRAQGRSLIMVFLDADGKLTRFADARRVLMQLALAQKTN